MTKNLSAQLNRNLLRATPGLGYYQMRGVGHDVYRTQFSKPFFVLLTASISEPCHRYSSCLRLIGSSARTGCASALLLSTLPARRCSTRPVFMQRLQ